MGYAPRTTQQWPSDADGMASMEALRGRMMRPEVQERTQKALVDLQEPIHTLVDKLLALDPQDGADELAA